MRDVIIRSRDDGIIALVPRVAPLDPGDRLNVIVTVLFVIGGFFFGGILPPVVAGSVAASCVAGEVVLGLKAAALALSRPVAKVLDVESFLRRRGR